jgi:hypothetical protein
MTVAPSSAPGDYRAHGICDVSPFKEARHACFLSKKIRGNRICLQIT